MGSQSNRTGRQGEELARRYLQQQGYRIIHKNYTIRGGEIDVITEKNGILVFVEVKTRRHNAFGKAEESFTPRKKRKLLRTIFHYLHDHPTSHWRCDLIALRIRGYTASVKHYHNIFHD